ncbi:hypothetical protein JCM11251_007917 [Rhodosporidiobolus azoricus]
MLRLLSVIFASIGSVSALTSEQLLVAFAGGNGGNLNGSVAKLPSFDLTVVRNSSHALFVVNATSTAPSDIGWLGIGQGTAMSNADYLLAWPTVASSDVSWTLSHRVPDSSVGKAHATPQLASTSSSSSTSTFFTLVPGLTTSSPDSKYASVAWLRAVQPGDGYPKPEGNEDVSLDGEERFIYASCSLSPGTADESKATFQQHNRPHGSTSLNLAAPFSFAAGSDGTDGSSADGGKSAVSGGSGQGRTSRDKALIAHATLGSVALVILTPSAILVARLGRNKHWFPFHAALNILSVVLVIVAFGIGCKEGGGGFVDFHMRLGLALFLLYLLQPALGALAHFFTRPNPSTALHPSLRGGPPPVLRAAHIVAGVVIVGLGYLQIANGLYKEWEEGSDAMTAVPKGVKVVFWVLLGVEVAAYVGTWIWGVVTRSRADRTEGAGWIRRPSTSTTGGGGAVELSRRGGNGEKVPVPVQGHAQA